jgi:hypothetical protein
MLKERTFSEINYTKTNFHKWVRRILVKGEVIGGKLFKR